MLEVGRLVRAFGAGLGMSLSIALWSPVAATAAPKAAPPAPTSPTVDRCYRHCVSPTSVHSLTPLLSVSVPGPDNERMSAAFEIRVAPRSRAPIVASTLTSSLPAVLPARWSVPEGALEDGKTYFWRARLVDSAGATGRWMAWQKMSVDTTDPGAVTLTSLDYERGVWGPVVGTEARFTAAVADPDVIEFIWRLDGGGATFTPAVGAGPTSATFSIAAPRSGIHSLSVEAVDGAGNVSDPTYFTYLVSPLPRVVGHWKLDEAAGSVAADSGNLALPGTLSGDVAFGPGFGGSNGAVFGPAGGRITAAGPMFDPAASFSIMFWVRPTDLTADRVAVRQGDTYLHFDREANDGAGGWCFTLSGDSPAATTVCARIPPVADEWVGLTARYDAVLKRASVHMAGGLDCEGDSVEAPAPGTAAAPAAFEVGGGPAGQWRGGIDDVYVIRVPVSDPEICQQAFLP